ncbi:YmdB family metallophosphoesterase [Patescibacteria group bacterium]
MKLLLIGDIVAKSGRQTITKILPQVKEELNPDIVIGNAENLSHGNGFCPDHIQEMQDAGIDFFTSGDHTWGNKNGIMMLNDSKFPVIRPANYPSLDTPGSGYRIIEDGNMNKVLVISLLGRVFMKKDYDCPFRKFDQILQENAHERPSAIIVDFHTEATSEISAFGFYVDGRATAVFGTHTHVPTADARVLQEGTAFMTDVGMTGPLDSVIGVKKDIIINSFLTQMPVKHEPELEGSMVFNAAFLTIDEKSKKALNIYHVQKVIEL